MKQFIPIACITLGALLAGGCATKSYVRKTVDPVSGRVDQVNAKADKQGQTLDDTRKSLDDTKQTIEKDETQLSAANERAIGADNRAGQALDSASQANQKADKLEGQLSELRGQVANLDDYHQVAETTVNFAFNSDKLNSESRQSLDQMVASPDKFKRFFVAVEGFTDQVGPADYNSALSRRRADAVVEYLVAEHNIPIYRIHMVGLGKMKPVDDAKTSAARAKNRRVEVTLFSADQNVAMNSQASASNRAPADH